MSRATRTGSLVTLAALLGLTLASVALAGTPATLDESAPPRPRPTAADSARKTAKTAPATTAKRAPATAAKTAAVAPATPSVKPGTKPPAPTAAKPGAPGGVAKAAPTTSAPTSVPRVARSAVPAGIPRVAAPTQGARPGAAALAKTTSPTVAPSGARAVRATAPTTPGTQARTVANISSVAPLAPTKGSSGPTLAQKGGTTVTAPGSKPTGTAAVTPLKPAGAAKAAVGAGVATRMTPGAKGVASAPSKPGVTAGTALEDHVTYQYNALGRRDPFQSLMEGEYVGADVGGQAPPDLGGLKLVGVVWGSTDQFAMVEDARGDSYVLRRGDRVMNGYVEGLKRDAMIVNITVDGQAQSVTIPITRKGEKSNANR